MSQPVFYEFTAEEREAIRRRHLKVLDLINAIAEIRGLPDGLAIDPEMKGLYLPGDQMTKSTEEKVG